MAKEGTIKTATVTERKKKVHSLIDICRTALEAARRLESHVSSWMERLHGRILH